MTKKQDEMMELLREIRDSLEEQALRIDEVENNFMEVTASISADLKNIIRETDIKKKAAAPKRSGLIDMADLIQESDQEN